MDLITGIALISALIAVFAFVKHKSGSYSGGGSGGGDDYYDGGGNSSGNDTHEVTSVDTTTRTYADGSGLWGSSGTETTTTTHYSDGTSESRTDYE